MRNLAIHSPGRSAFAATPLPLGPKIREAFSRSPRTILVILLSVSLLLQSQLSNAQAPQQFSFQGVARDATGKIVTNKEIGYSFNIHKGTPVGTIKFTREGNTTTDASGVFNITIGTEAFPNWSDQRLKTNIRPVHNSLGNLRQIHGYNYYWKDKKTSQDLQTGVIAQEIEKVFPELVSVGENKYKSVNYIGLIPHLIEAVKELDKKTEEIATLKKELASMQEMNKKLIALEASVRELLAGKATTSTQASK